MSLRGQIRTSLDSGRLGVLIPKESNAITRDITHRLVGRRPARWTKHLRKCGRVLEFSYQKPLFGASASAASEGDGPNVNYAGPTEEARRICRVRDASG